MQDEELIRKIFKESKTIAVVGLSPKSYRDSHEVAAYLQGKGYKIVPVYPREEEILGEKVYRSLKDIPFPIDIVDVFRRSEEVMPIVQAAVEIGAKAVWLQLGIRNDEAKDYAKTHKIPFIQNRCMLVEHSYL